MQSYRRIFWSFIFATFNLHIGALTIIPPFIGWIVVYSGLLTLGIKAREQALARQRITCVCLIVLSALNGFLMLINASGLFRMLLPILVMVGELVFFHFLFSAIVEHFKTIEYFELATIYAKKDRTYLVLKGLATLFMTVSLSLNHQLLGLGGAILTLIALIHVLTALYWLNKGAEQLLRRRQQALTFRS
ncbi:hypothetical protein SAMN04488134_101225 [Amphibacillus marinus]|uniref:Uncharacterized protein n=1 Tax=Amphibacillus marinus TaxID=872970 RepID=A0A1H8H0W3_9BACI|nr:hypothetical protein [Amphibacillus marinus]SEN49876.1 hypothetical protein SAMN04488134_101225 [Amphibacillus marinus]